MRVKDVISSKGSESVYTIAPDATIHDLLDRLAERNVGALVVSTDGSHMLGIVSERDVVRKLRGMDNPTEHPVESIMTSDVHTCTPDDPITGVLELMTEHRVRHMPVLEDERLAAVISIGDAVKFRMDQLKFERDQLNDYVATSQ